VKGGERLNPKSYKPEPGNEAPAINESEVPLVLKLHIAPELYAEYEQSALSQGLTPTELILHRLKRCREHTGLRPLYFNDTQRAQLETILQKKPLENAEQALALIKAGLSVRIGDLPPIQLTAQQVKRIGMAGYAGQSAEERLNYIIKGAISKALGV
jgi:hypothetical protein